MKSKSFFKKLYSAHIKQAKIFMLAGLMGGFTACKDNVFNQTPEKQIPQRINPDSTKTKSNTSNDSFMQHLSNIDGAYFYIGTTDDLRFSTGPDGKVNRLYSYNNNEESDNIDYSINSDLSVNRIFKESSDGTAWFDCGNTYEFFVGTEDQNWEMTSVPPAVFHDTFEKMTHEEFAQFVKKHLESRNADYWHTKYICDSIAAGGGRWTYIGEVLVPIYSKGAKVGLKHSDFGLVNGTTPIAKEPEKRETFPYCGGVTDRKIQTPDSYEKFIGTAYASVLPMKTSGHGYGGIYGLGLQVFETYPLSATFVHGFNADTLTMPFDNWCTVKIIVRHSDQQIEIHTENYQSNFDADIWAIRNMNNQNLPMETETSDFGNDFYFSDQENLSITISAPDYFSDNEDISTGLNTVYCTPGKKRLAGNIKTPREVVVQGFYTETFDATQTNAMDVNFVFGGINQKQR